MLLRVLINRGRPAREFMQNFPIGDDQEVIGIDDSDEVLWMDGLVWVEVELGERRLTKAQREFISSRAEEYHTTSKY